MIVSVMNSDVSAGTDHGPVMVRLGPPATRVAPHRAAPAGAAGELTGMGQGGHVLTSCGFVTSTAASDSV